MYTQFVDFVQPCPFWLRGCRVDFVVAFRGPCGIALWNMWPIYSIQLLLRFRENPVTIHGDISKMYHQVRDQHVHRYVWRDMEVDRDPDTFVKTVLTFGNKPAPAMA